MIYDMNLLSMIHIKRGFECVVVSATMSENLNPTASTVVALVSLNSIHVWLGSPP